jgi:preprotein translocase subunit SecF
MVLHDLALRIYVFGGDALRGFVFTMLVRIVAGTYSTLFIPSATAILLSGRRASRVRQGVACHEQSG